MTMVRPLAREPRRRRGVGDAGRTLALLSAVLLAACAAPGPGPAVPPPPVAAPASWQAPLPHQGQATALVQWWSRSGDPVLASLVEAAQSVSPTLATARSRIEQARAVAVVAAAARLPQADAVAGASRGRTDVAAPVSTVAQLALQASWEIDLFGAARAGLEASQARLEGAEAAWHAARVSVAAEVAYTYAQLRACEAQLQLQEADAASRAETARATERSAQAGVTPGSAAAQARASAAQGRAQATALRSQCDSLVKALVALTGQDEPGLVQRLRPGYGRVPQPEPIAFDALPAGLLAQRPDLAESAATVTAAAADVRLTEARRYPRVALGGALGVMAARTEGLSRDGATWTLGPLQVTFPVFDGGVRRADEAAARAAYADSVAQYQARLRTAVREVEDALLQLDSTRARQADASSAAEGYGASFEAAQSRFKGGVSTIFELEDARRTSLASRVALVDLQRERALAWIALYRALGGGWQSGATVPAAPR
jgi:NodT family efflux transporter outer membrane factor (OMF) lipoprotein